MTTKVFFQRSLLRWAQLLAFFLPAILGHSGEPGQWVDLFDGKSTQGWTPRDKVVKFEAANGELHLLSKTNVWVVTDRVMTDFEVELDVLLPEGGSETGFNSGLAFRCTGKTGKPKGYQCEIESEQPGESGGIYGIGLGGWLYPKNDQQRREYLARISGVLKKREWNHYRVRCQGPRIQSWVNGKLIADLNDSQSLKGYFGIQHHGRGGMVRFRNIRARDLSSPSAAASRPAAEKPNILWITAEDMSPTLGCYGDKYATTPNLDRLAKESVVYTNAFASAPVCSPSRSCLITGMNPVSMGTDQMRSSFPLPLGVHGFPSFLRKAGFYTTNNVKTDYNNGDALRVTRESWDDSSSTAHWRNADRKNGQPFFAVFNDMVSHQSRTMVWPYHTFRELVQSKLSAAEIHDPQKAPVPPYYPDTPVVRKTIARFYDCVTVMDHNVGRILSELKEDGLAGNTIVFFFSDHGSGMPRHKRLLLDSGMKVAMMVRFPKKYQHLAPARPGEKLDRLVSFVDFPPTVLSLLGIEAPAYMQGQAFLGKEAKKPEREFVYGARDRVDEAFECARSIRSKKYLYIRNYMPHLSYNQPSVFSDLSEIRPEITRMAAENPESMTPAQLAYAGPTKPAEEFYDCESDPLNLHNLVGQNLTDTESRELERHRSAFRKTRKKILDVGALPESIAWDIIREEGAPLRNVVLGETNHHPDLQEEWKAADLVGRGSKKHLLSLLKSPDPSVRFWGIIGLRNAGFADQSLWKQSHDFLADISPVVRIETASWLASAPSEYRKEAVQVLITELRSPDWWTALRACRAIELLGRKAKEALPVMRKLYESTRHEKGDENFFIAFSSGAFLAKLGQATDPWDFTPNAGSFSADPPEKKKR